MKHLIILLSVILSGTSSLSGQYTTDYPFDSEWVDNFTGPVFNIQDLGAIPDDDINDSEYLRMAADSIEYYGTGKIYIPAGIYIVGEQTIDPDPTKRYYNAVEMFIVDNVDEVIIEGEAGAILKLSEEIRFGSFDPATGEAYYPPPGGFFNGIYAAFPGQMFQFNNSTNILFDNLELDGNNENIVIGGYYGDTGYQLSASGVVPATCRNVMIRDIYTHHHGQDGVMVLCYEVLEEDSEPTVHVLENVESEYNGRQGLSWAAGIGLTAYNCKFNHSGKAGLSSAPGAGVDIESEISIIRGGKFIDCETINNSGVGFLVDSGDGGYTVCENCTFWGNTNWAMWNDKPGMKFYDCNFYGSIVHSYGSFTEPELATKYYNCYFEDKEHPEYGVWRGNFVINHDVYAPTSGNGITFDGCTIVANEIRSVWIKNNQGDGLIDIKNTSFTHKAQLPKQFFQANFYKVHFEDVQFLEDFPESCTDSMYYINVYGWNEIGNCTFVDGPAVKWRHWNHPDQWAFGWIDPGVHGVEHNAIHLLAPNGGEVWEKGSVQNIDWDNNYAAYGEHNINLFLYKGCEFLDTIAFDIVNEETFEWTVSDTLEIGDDYSVKIVSAQDPWVLNLSADFFEIAGSGLPLELLNFNASLQSDERIMLSWETIADENINYFDIERSDDNLESWEVIDRVESLDNGAAKVIYKSYDENLSSSTLYYRLKQVDSDGCYVYSKIINIIINDDRFSTYPNPTDDMLNIIIEGDGQKEIRILDVNGRLKIQKFVSIPHEQIDVSHLVNGVYFILFLRENERVKQKKLLIHR